MCITISADGDRSRALASARGPQTAGGSGGEHVDVSPEVGDEDNAESWHFFGILDSEGRSITVAATAPEAPRKVPLSGLKLANVNNAAFARVSATVTSMEATWTVVDGVRELDEVRVEFRQRSDSTTTVRCTVE